MHLVRIDAVSLDEGEAAVDLGQEPGDLVVLSFTDSDLAGIAQAHAAEPGLPSLRLAKLAKLRHPMSVDLYVERVVSRAKLVVIRCLGGLDYWRYGIERSAAAARANGVVLAVLPGDDRPDPRLAGFSTDPDFAVLLDGYFRAGGPENLRRMLRLLAARIGAGGAVEPPQPLPRGFPWCPGCGVLTLDTAIKAAETAVPLSDPRVTATPLVLLLVYRSAVLGGDTAPFVVLTAALRARGIGVLPMAVSSLREPEAAAAVAAAVRAEKPDLVIAATAFSAREDGIDFVLDGADCPVLQAFTVGSPRAAWEASARGLGAADLAMQVALPEFDGRLSGFPISFKEESPEVAGFAERRAVPYVEGIAALAERAHGWLRLAALPRAERCVAVVLSDYPARGGRAGFAVGLDTPESARALASDLVEAGYATGALPESAAVMRALTEGAAEFTVPLAEYAAWLAELPAASRDALMEAWGEPADDPMCRDDLFRFRIVRSRTAAPPPPSAGEGGRSRGSGEGSPACGEGSPCDTSAGVPLPLSQPLLTQGPPSPEEGGGMPPRRRGRSGEQPRPSHHRGNCCRAPTL
ncbi:cobaltochelatase subunit CobN, partial [Methylobacterium sp. J-077]|uniref:cobaltochelatase subunit CobN n=1 Tax=Methylobacterium sp. J-077 TaxID=2836656 RepID=UPI001FBBD720